MQSRHFTVHHHKTRAGDFRRGLKIKPLLRHTQINVVFNLKIKLARLTPCKNHHVSTFIGTYWHCIVQQVWNT